jgi:trafficking protein particle complex subunit 5
MSNKKSNANTSILAKPLPTGRSVSLSAFTFVYNEMINYYRNKGGSLADLETRLDNAGYNIGLRFLELISFKDKPGKRETSTVSMLQFLSSSIWQHLFGKQADALEKSTEDENTFMIRDDEPITNFFISVPKDLSRFNPACFIAGILRGLLDGAGFECTVQAVNVAVENGPRDKTVYVVKFTTTS